MKEKIFDKLYAFASNGKQKEWSISVHEEESGVCQIRRTHGFTDCKMQTTNKPVMKGKNIGRANETTIFEQAVSDAQSMWNKKSDRAYTAGSPKKEDPKPLPMLALPFNKRKHNINYPCYVQPKLDGVRCFGHKVDETTMEYTSRNGKIYDTLGHMDKYLLEKLEVGDIVDGEIYVHGMNFQQIVRLVKKLRPESRELEYHIYDKADSTLPYKDRHDWVCDTFHDWMENNNPVWIVGTFMAESEEYVYVAHESYVKDGYEGVIIRNGSGMYKFRHRSKDLQKYKEFKDEEFKVVGGKKATGIHKGCVVLECALENGNTFDVYPRGTLDYRRHLLKDLDKIIGKMLTVRYQGLSEDGVPIFPIGIVVRDYE